MTVPTTPRERFTDALMEELRKEGIKDVQLSAVSDDSGETVIGRLDSQQVQDLLGRVITKVQSDLGVIDGNLRIACAMMAREMEAHGGFDEVLSRPAVKLSVLYSRKWLYKALGLEDHVRPGD